MLCSQLCTTGEEQPSSRDVVVHLRSGGVRRLSELNPTVHPLHYPLLFPYGDHGWEIGIPLARRPAATASHVELEVNSSSTAPVTNSAEDNAESDFTEQREVADDAENASTVTMMRFTAYRMMVRNAAFSALHMSQRLFQEWLVDSFANMEGQRLAFIKYNQRKLRAETYSGVVDHVERGDANAATLGQRVILPSTHPQSPRNLHQLYHDAMAIVRKYGSPDLFITFTCNPNWEEIRRELHPGQSAFDRPDLTARVFRLKLKELLQDLFSHGIMGRVIGRVYVIEFQKRGLPHVHILIILASEDKPRDVADIDSIVSAEIPDPTEDPEYHEVVRTCLMQQPYLT